MMEIPGGGPVTGHIPQITQFESGTVGADADLSHMPISD
jgi:hypothetical protein